MFFYTLPSVYAIQFCENSAKYLILRCQIKRLDLPSLCVDSIVTLDKSLDEELRYCLIDWFQLWCEARVQARPHQT